ncbi:hypothetical protein DSECCO2_615500 [anaerobic digester metagenome]
MDGVALLGNTYDGRSHGLEECAVLHKRLLHLIIALGGQIRAEPGIADLKTSELQCLLEHFGVLGVFIAHFTAGKSGEGHLADALFKGDIASKLG